MQNAAARAFGADHTFFLVNGASVGNMAAILSCVCDGEKILVARDSHRSAYAGIALSGAVPVYLPPMHNSELDGLHGVCVDHVYQALMNDDDIKAVFITRSSKH